MAKAPDKILDPFARGSLYSTEEPEFTEAIARIDLEVAGSGEISAAITLVRTVCPVLYMGTYSGEHVRGQAVYVRVAASGAQRAADVLERYGFKVKAVRQESDSSREQVSSARN
jgi:hypothetical protein